MACGQEDVDSEELILIEDFLSDRTDAFEFVSEDLYYSIIDSGSIESPSFNSTVIINYRLYSLQEVLLDSLLEDLTIEFDLLINGIITTLPQIGRGGRMLVVMSSNQANGDLVDMRVPPNSPLFIDISLIDHYTDITEYHQRLIETYLVTNELPDSIESGDSFYVVEAVGSLTPVVDTSIVSMTYVGYFLDGMIFDDRYIETDTTFVLSEAIRGWQDILVNFNLGGSGTMLIPSESAYGEAGTDLVPSDTPVLFDFSITRIE